jgi:hypothetical protein
MRMHACMEWMIEKEKEIPNGKGKAYRLTSWGDSYLKKVYLPVLERNSMLRGFTSILEDAMPRIVTKRFFKLVNEISQGNR